MLLEYRKPEAQLMGGAGRMKQVVTATVIDCAKTRGWFRVVCWLTPDDRNRLQALGVHSTTIEFPTDELGSRLIQLNDHLKITVSASTPDQRIFIGDAGQLLLDEITAVNPVEVVRRFHHVSN